VVTLGTGDVVVIRFPFSDLSASKVRPAVVLARSGRSDWILCQVTSNPYGDPDSIRLTGSSFSRGGLERDSYARAGKLFTADTGIVLRIAGTLGPQTHRLVVDAAIRILAAGVPK
jgi:mRNA interferase MazF